VTDERKDDGLARNIFAELDIPAGLIPKWQIEWQPFIESLVDADTAHGLRTIALRNDILGRLELRRRGKAGH
jgi:hypothetical protein